MKHLSDDEYLYGNEAEQQQEAYENPSIDEALDETDSFEYDGEDREHLHQPSKYDIALGKYNTALNDAEVAKQTAQLLEKHLDENNTVEVKKFLFNCIDLTTLKCTDSEESVMKFTERVNDFVDAYPDLKNVAAICVYPNMAEIVNDTLEADDVKIACVSGGFPSSQTFIEVKVAETAMALHTGADEIDIVIPVIKKASILSMYSGADFIKTSTGKERVSATPEAAFVMCKAIKEYFLETGRKVGFKPAGGINTVKDALVYYTIVKEVLGKEWLNNELFRLGTSRLANLLLSEIVGSETKFF